MQQGDFTALAKDYVHRPAYAEGVIDVLFAQAGPSAVAADVGAGTGKLTGMLSGLGLNGFAVEPNDAMRREGEALDLPGFRWRAGAAEATTLPDQSVDLVTMASAFHWTDQPRALAEFHRILRPGGLLAVMWNPRDLTRDRLQAEIEETIAALLPDVRRKSSGAAAYTAGVEDVLVGSGLFRAPLFLEAPHELVMSPEDHLGAWRSVNDIQSKAAEAGPGKWQEILDAIAAKLEGRDQVRVLYRTRAWIVRKA